MAPERDARLAARRCSSSPLVVRRSTCAGRTPADAPSPTSNRAGAARRPRPPARASRRPTCTWRRSTAARPKPGARRTQSVPVQAEAAAAAAAAGRAAAAGAAHRASGRRRRRRCRRSRLKFIGALEPANEAEDRGAERRPGQSVYGKEGDIIEGRYRILRIGAESIEMAYLDGRGRQTIRLSGSMRFQMSRFRLHDGRFVGLE